MRKVYQSLVSAVAAAAVASLTHAAGFPSAGAPQGGQAPAGISDLVKRKRLEIVNDPASLARVQTVVRNIYRVADEHAGTTPEVAIVTGRPSAEAVEGRYILVSESMAKELADDNELAIVLGHEIAHLVRGHTYGASRENDVATAAEHLSFDQSLIPGLQNAVSQGVEAEADRYGLLYAALAGYDVSRAKDVYDKILTSLPDVVHPPKEEREKIFRERLQNILDNVEVFNAGVDYALRGLYALSIQAYENLLRDEYRSRDIYLNLGAFHHLLAFRYLKPEESPADICSLTLELQSGFEPQGLRRGSGQTRGTGGANEADRAKYREHLNKAADEYQQALRASPDYSPARNNLGCAFLHRGDDGDVDQAAGELKRAAKLEPDNAVIANNLGVAYLRLDQRDKALAQFRRALQLNSEFVHADYNLGVTLLADRTPAAEAEARKALQAYLEGKEGMRTAYYVSQARQRLGLEVEASPALAAGAPAVQLVVQGLPLLPGQSISQLSPDLHPDRDIKLIPEYEVELLKFPDWRVTVRGDAVDQVTVASPQFHTAEHIAVGSTVDEIRKAYGRPDMEQARGESRMLVYLKRGLLFRAQGNRVSSWAVFKAV